MIAKRQKLPFLLKFFMIIFNQYDVGELASFIFLPPKQEI